MFQLTGMCRAAEVFSWLCAAQKQPDGTLQTQAVNVGRGDTPPM